MRVGERYSQSTEEITASLRVFVEGAIPGAETMLAPLRKVLEAPISLVYGFPPMDRALELVYAHASGFDARRAGEIVKLGVQGNRFLVDPPSPRPGQGNRVLAVGGLRQLIGREPDIQTNEVHPTACMPLPCALKSDVGGR